MIRKKIVLRQLEAVQALQWTWQCDEVLAMALMDQLWSQLQNSVVALDLHFFRHFVFMNNKQVHLYKLLEGVREGQWNLIPGSLAYLVYHLFVFKVSEAETLMMLCNCKQMSSPDAEEGKGIK